VSSQPHAVISLTTADIANCIIRDGIEICGARVRGERTKYEPLQCLKCRGWEHKAQDCEAQLETCSTCSENHRTNACKNKDNLYCASCKTNSHASWDKACPEFLRRCSTYNDKYPENDMVYFPTEQEWTLTTRPSRIPPEERFPQLYAVNSLPSAVYKPHRPVERLPPNKTPGRNNPSQSKKIRVLEPW
jgi:hypothetical protein